METHASVSSNNQTEVSVTDTTVSVAYDGTTRAEACLVVSNDYAEASVAVSAKTGTEASFSGGLEGNNVYAEANYSDTTCVEVTAEAGVGYEGVGVSASGTAYASVGQLTFQPAAEFRFTFAVAVEHVHPVRGDHFDAEILRRVRELIIVVFEQPNKGADLHRFDGFELLQLAESGAAVAGKAFPVHEEAAIGAAAHG